MKQSYLDQFVLVGGTALALQIGHRSSIDLDLFSSIPFSAATLYEQLCEDFQAGEPVVKDRSKKC